MSPQGRKQTNSKDGGGTGFPQELFYNNLFCNCSLKLKKILQFFCNNEAVNSLTINRGGHQYAVGLLVVLP